MKELRNCGFQEGVRSNFPRPEAGCSPRAPSLPFVGTPILFILAFRGREAAWKAGNWATLKAFEAAQKQWLYWSTMLSIALSLELAVFACFLIAPMLDDLQELEQVMELPKE